MEEAQTIREGVTLLRAEQPEESWRSILAVNLDSDGRGTRQKLDQMELAYVADPRLGKEAPFDRTYQQRPGLFFIGLCIQDAPLKSGLRAAKYMSVREGNLRKEWKLGFTGLLDVPEIRDELVEAGLDELARITLREWL